MSDLTLKLRVVGLNHLLSTLYPEPTRISTLLEAAGYSSQQLAALSLDDWQQLTETAINFFRACPGRLDNKGRNWEIICRRYELDGNAKSTLEELGKRWEVTRERIRQIEKRLLKAMRTPLYRARLEQHLMTVAYARLGEPQIAKPLPSLANSSNYLKLIQRIRNESPNAYMPWSAEEENELHMLFGDKTPIEMIALKLERQPSAIKSRLRKLGYSDK